MLHSWNKAIVIMAAMLVLSLLLAPMTAEAVMMRGAGGALPPVSGPPGPSSSYYNSTKYTCSTNYYISTAGSDSNGGTSPGDAWATLAHAESASPDGPACFNIAPGIYTITADISLDKSGNAATPSGYRVWRCEVMPFYYSGGALQGGGTGCVLRASGLAGTHIMEGNGNYLWWDALEFDGNGDGTTTQNYSLFYFGNYPFYTGHHYYVTDSYFHDGGSSGIASAGGDYLFVVHNHIQRNSYQSPNMGSGVSLWQPVGVTGYTPTAQDLAWCITVPESRCFDIVQAYNVSVNNYNPQTGPTTDGRGAFFDQWSHGWDACPPTGVCPIHGNGLIMGNVTYHNGAGGVSCNEAGNLNVMYFVNNTSYDNGWDPHSTVPDGEYTARLCENIKWINNIAQAVGHLTYQADTGTGNLWQTNIAYPAGQTTLGGGSFPTVGPNHNLDGSDPKFVSVTPGSLANNFALQAGSPAIGFGQPFSLWPQTTGSVDAGACPATLTSCP